MYVYILKSKKADRVYIGSTDNIKLRILHHNKGYNYSTKSYRSWEIARLEKYSNKSLALKREKFLKTGKGRETLKNLLNK